jgi:hypothetical protein
MSHADKEEASEGAARFLSVDIPVIIIVRITVFIAGHET